MIFGSIIDNNAVFGLDIGFETLKLVQIEKRKNICSLVGAIEIPIAERILERDSFKDKAKITSLIKEACRKAKPNPIWAKKIVTALPETFVFSKTIQMPKMSQKEYEEAVPIEAAKHLPIPAEETYIDFQVLIVHPEEAMADILLVASPKKLVDDYVEVSRLAGFELSALETKPIAVGRAVSFVEKLNGCVIAEVGTEITRISIWDHNNIRLNSSVNVGKNQIQESGNDSLIFSIASEIINAIKYHQKRDYKPSKIMKIYLCGSGAKIDRIDEIVEKETRIDTEIIGPKVKEKKELGTEFITSFGLSMRSEEE